MLRKVTAKSAIILLGSFNVILGYAYLGIPQCNPGNNNFKTFRNVCFFQKMLSNKLNISYYQLNGVGDSFYMLLKNKYQDKVFFIVSLLLCLMIVLQFNNYDRNELKSLISVNVRPHEKTTLSHLINDLEFIK